MLETLYTTHEDDEPVDLAGPIGDPMVARSLLIELQVNARRAEQLKATLASVEGEYRARLEKLAEREAAIRQSLAGYVQENGKVSFPDVGGCSLSQRKPRPKIVDRDAAIAWFQKHAPQGVETITEQRILPDVLKDVFERVGMVPDGVEVERPEPTLTIRKAAA